MSMTVAEKREALRERLIEAAAATVEHGGMSSLRVKEVAKAAGCSLGQIYTFFEDIDALIVAVNSRTIAELDAHLAARSERAAGGTPQQMLVALALAYLEFADGRRNVWASLFERAATSGKAAPDWHRAEHLALVARIVGPLRDMLPDWCDERVGELALSMFSMVHGIVSIGLQETVVSVPVKQLAAQLETVVEALCRGLDR
jgi:AcrR family transcriptional regulator